MNIDLLFTVSLPLLALIIIVGLQNLSIRNLIKRLDAQEQFFYSLFFNLKMDNENE